MGLAAAYQAVDCWPLGGPLLEAAPEDGWHGGAFDRRPVSIERFYHFVCKADEADIQV